MIVFSAGGWTFRTCVPSDLDALYAAHEDTLQSVIADLSAQLERDKTLDYGDLSGGLRVLVAEAHGKAIGVVSVNIRGGAATLSCRTIPGNPTVPDDEAWSVGLYAVEYCRSIGCATATARLMYRERDAVTQVHNPIQPMNPVFGGLWFGAQSAP